MFPNLRQDFARLRDINTDKSDFRIFFENFFFNAGFQAVLLFRIAHWFKTHKLLFGLWPLIGVAPFFGRLCTFLTGVEIDPAATIGPGLMISHGQGIVIGKWARLGENATLMQQVTIGAKSIGSIEQMPEIGDHVFIGAGARVLGGISVGDRVEIGANAVVTRDVKPGHMARPANRNDVVAKGAGTNPGASQAAR